MVVINTIDINPPLINSSSAWASDFAQLRELYDCPYTGAITTRTATPNGYPENETHTVTFSATAATSLNSYGYSPHPLRSYIAWVYELLSTPTEAASLPTKPIIISITSATPTTLKEMVTEVTQLRSRLHDFHLARERPAVGAVDPSTLVAVELNTSCPNIKDTPPPAYSFDLLLPFLDALASAYYEDPTLTIGLKLPPYLYSTSFREVVQHLSTYSRPGPNENEKMNPFAFVTCTNTLGSSLMFNDQVAVAGPNTPFALPTPLGGLGGEALHSLALGNVYSFRQLFAQHSDPAIQKIVIIGVGGVTSSAARQRMVQAGASVVGCATLLGQLGVKAFQLLTGD